ncbi:MAG: MBL fold metallo-hydrolase [Armatimonadetes bacterium]|nr:MBL fold metallo-hydrolase [Armatimonadota bacterium]MDE2207659.1 MBL fold metallo-hydrolase [Armatimonadota bacterium]
MIGCTCAVCTSTNPKNRRTRPSIAVEYGSSVLVVDTGPEFRLQALAAGLSRVDAVLITHTHADHIFGMDDLRRFNDLAHASIPVYGSASTLEDIRRIFDYIFKPTQAGGGKPRITLHELPSTLELCGLEITVLEVLHGRLPVQAFRFDVPSGPSAAYITDVNTIPEAAMSHLGGLDLLILDAVRFEPHSTHFGLWQAVEVAGLLKPAMVRFTHLSHHFDHEEVNGRLPQGMSLAFDGEVLTL